MKPEVSVILPTYNRAGILEESIASVLGQTYGDLELIVVDDGSTDGTAELIGGIRDPRLRYIRLDENGGGAAARNIGLENASGRYIAFQDSDDKWHREKLERQVQAINDCSPETGVVYSSYVRIAGSRRTRIPYEWVRKKDGELLRELLKINFIGLPAALVRKECFDRVGYFDEELPRLVDWDMWIRIAKHYRFAFIDEVLLTSYHLEDSVTAVSDKYKEALKIILERHRYDFMQEGRSYAYHLYSLGRASCASGAYDEGRDYVLRAFRVYPFAFPRLFLTLLVVSGRRPCCIVMQTGVGVKRRVERLNRVVRWISGHDRSV